MGASSFHAFFGKKEYTDGRTYAIQQLTRKKIRKLLFSPAIIYLLWEEDSARKKYVSCEPVLTV